MTHIHVLNVMQTMLINATVTWYGCHFWRVDYLELLTCNTGFFNCFCIFLQINSFKNCSLSVWLISIYISGDIRLIVLRPRIEISNHITRLISPHNSARRRGISYLSEVRIWSEEQVPVLHLYSGGDLELTFNMLHNYKLHSTNYQSRSVLPGWEM